MKEIISAKQLRAELSRLRRQHAELTEFNSGYKNAISDVLSLICSLTLVQEEQVEIQHQN